MKKQLQQDITIWYGVFIRAIIVGGMFLFGNAVTTGFNLKGAFIVAGLYAFLELAKRYGLQDFSSKKKLDNYRFILFP